MMETKSEITKICLVCMDRTGSNLLSSRLDTHEKLCFYNEVFHRQFIIFRDDRIVSSPDVVFRRDRAPAAFVSQIWNGAFETKAQRASLEGIGFKLFINHNANALRYVINSDAKIIYLRRRNPLHRFSSFKIAAATGEWKQTDTAQRGPKKKPKIKFSPSEFRAYVNNYESLESLFEMTLNRWNRSHFNVWYEDFVSDTRVWNDLVEYIGFDPKDFGQSSLVKQNSPDIADRFSNPDEVFDFVKSLNKQEWLL